MQRNRIIDRLFATYIAARIREATDPNVDALGERTGPWRSLTAREGPTDITYSTLKDDQEDALEAWRTNPLAHRITELTTDYVLGKGVEISAKPKRINDFIQTFWYHPLNRLQIEMHTFCTDLSMTGELFITFHTNPYDAMTYVRAVPANLIDDIETAPNDITQELRYHQIADQSQGTEPHYWTADEMHHYAINRPVGSKRGQSDMKPILPWLSRYKDWLTDRVIINKFKTAYLWDISLQGATAGTIKARIAEIAANPPNPGSFIVHNESEVWEAKRPDIGADDAQPDGLAIRLAIAAGAGIPLHFLGEGAGANRATAYEMSEPTERHYQRRQLYVHNIIHDILDTAIARAHGAGATIPAKRKHQIAIRFPDLTAKTNASTATALRDVVQALGLAVEKGWINNETAQLWLYGFANERMLQEADSAEEDA